MVTGARAGANLLTAPALLARWWVVRRRQLAVGLAPRGGVASWGERLGNPMLAAAILDRLLHRGIVVAIDGPSQRRFCSPRCRVADWHARHDRPPRTSNAVPHTTTAANPVPPDSPPTNGVPAANGVQRCPHCHHELAVIVLTTAAHIRTPEVIPISPT